MFPIYDVFTRYVHVHIELYDDVETEQCKDDFNLK